MTIRLSRDWLLHHRLGSGGYGEVWEASTSSHGVRVALKLLPPVAAPAGALPDEVAILASLRHPGVVRLLDAGSVTAPVAHIAPGSTWLAMERVAGRALGVGGLRGSRSLVALLFQLLDTMAYIHACGYVHGDLSPANVLWSLRDWNVKVVDFGLARTVGHQAESAIGTPGFLAPEQRTGAPLVPSADLYSIGRLGLRLLQGTLLQNSRQPGLPVDRLAEWLGTLAHPDPRTRPPRAAEARAWLTELVGARPTFSVARVGTLPMDATDSTPVPTGTLPSPMTATAEVTGQVSESTGGPVSRSPSPWASATLPIPPAVPQATASLELGWMATGTSLFAARDARLVGRDELRKRLWQALIDSADRPLLLRLDGPVGVGITALLEDIARHADASGTARVVREPVAATSARHTVLWVLDDASEEVAAFVKQARSGGLVLLGRGPELGETVHVAPLPVPLRAALVRAMLPVTADVAGWLALRAAGLPGETRRRLQDLLEEERFQLDGRRYGWADGRRPNPEQLDAADQLAAARADFEAAANELSWSRLMDLEAAGLVRPGHSHHAAWLDMVSLLADRLPRDVPLSMLSEASPGTDAESLPSADAVYHRGMRMLRLQQRDRARALFQHYIDRVDTPAQRALGSWQLGAVAFGSGDFAQAQVHFESAHALLAGGDDPKRLAHTLLALSLVASNLGHFEEALVRAEEATQAFEAIGQPRHRANIADFESTCYLWLGQLELAEARARESLARYADDGSPNRLVPLLNLAAALHHQGRAAVVREILDEVARRAGFEDPRLLGVVALYGALFAAEEGDGDAWEHHWAGFEQVWATGVGWHPATARMLVDIREHAVRQEWTERARRMDERVDELRERFGDDVLGRFGVERAQGVTELA